MVAGHNDLKAERAVALVGRESDSQGINIQGPKVILGQNKGQGAPIIQLQAVQTPAGEDITQTD